MSEYGEWSARRLKTITSYTGVARWLAECDAEPVAWLARVQCEAIPSLYVTGPSTRILRWNGRQVVYFETRHNHYEVFEVPATMWRFRTDDEAAAWHLIYCRKAG